MPHVLPSALLWQYMARVRGARALVVNCTNQVAMQPTANALLAAGASPVMTESEEELPELLARASALVLNIGTLSAVQINVMRKALGLAHVHGVPVVLDPVGAGATTLRTTTALALLAAGQGMWVRGNPSEIMALAEEGMGAASESAPQTMPSAASPTMSPAMPLSISCGMPFDTSFDTALDVTGASPTSATRGVDSTAVPEQAAKAAVFLAQKYGCAVCASGEVDLITDGRYVWRVYGGSSLMPLVTGMGCTASALAGAFAGAGSVAGKSTVSCAEISTAETFAAGKNVSGDGIAVQPNTPANAVLAALGDHFVNGALETHVSNFYYATMGNAAGDVQGFVAALAVMAAAGGKAACQAKGPGSLWPSFLDALYSLTVADLAQHASVTVSPV